MDQKNGTMTLQFLRELHFIEAARCFPSTRTPRALQFLRELHFIEAGRTRSRAWRAGLQFLRELHFIEAARTGRSCRTRSCCSSSGNCTSLRHRQAADRRLRRRCCSFSGNCTSLRPDGHAHRPHPLPCWCESPRV